jgi:hypothetical protein
MKFPFYQKENPKTTCSWGYTYRKILKLRETLISGCDPSCAETHKDIQS